MIIHLFFLVENKRMDLVGCVFFMGMGVFLARKKLAPILSGLSRFPFSFVDWEGRRMGITT